MSLELDNESQELEKYGVWVKKPAPAQEESPAENSFLQESSTADIVADLPDFDFIDDPKLQPELSDMPDFDEFAMDSFSASSTDTEDFAIEDSSVSESAEIADTDILFDEPFSEVSDTFENASEEFPSFDIGEDISQQDISFDGASFDDISLDNSVEDDTIEFKVPSVDDELSLTDDFIPVTEDAGNAVLTEDTVSEEIAEANTSELNADDLLSDTENVQATQLESTDSPDDIFSEEFAFESEPAEQIDSVLIEENADESDNFTAAEKENEVTIDDFTEISLDDFDFSDESDDISESQTIPSADVNNSTVEESSAAAETVTVSTDTDDQELFGDVSFEDISSDAVEGFGEIEFSDVSNETPVIETPVEQTDDSTPGTDFSFDLDGTTEISFETESGEPEISASNITEEIDIDSFLDFSSDYGTTVASEEVSFEDTGIRDFTTSESVSLDDFMSTPAVEKNDVVNDPPLSIDLSFDDSFTGSTEASPENDIESESDVVSFDMDTEEESFDVDDIFDSIQEVSFPGTETEEPQIPVETETMSFDEVSEFDDILGDLNASTDAPKDTENAQASQQAAFTPSTPQIRDYDMTVSLDDSDEDDDFDESALAVTAKISAPAGGTPVETSETVIPPAETEEAVAEESVEDVQTEDSIPEESETEDSDPLNLTEEDIMTDDMKSVLSQINGDFETANPVTISQDALDKLISSKSEIETGSPVEEGSAMADNMNTELLEKILSEISSLKKEVADIRSEVDSLKVITVASESAPEDEETEVELPDEMEIGGIDEPAVDEAAAEPETVDETEAEDEISSDEPVLSCEVPVEEEPAGEPVPETECQFAETDEPLLDFETEGNSDEEPVFEDSSTGGFFGDSDEDDTIALSGDELDNILNSANFTEEEAPSVTLDEESDSFYEDADVTDTSDLSESFEALDQSLEEPVIDEFALSEEPVAEAIELPEEIEIPQMEGEFVVESSSTDFLDGMEEEKSIADSITSENNNFLSSDENIDVLAENLAEEAAEPVESEEPAETEEHVEPVEAEDSDELTGSFPTEEDITLSANEESFSVFDENEPAVPEDASEVKDSAYEDEEEDTTPTDIVFDGEQWPAVDSADQDSAEPVPEEETVAEQEVIAEPEDECFDMPADTVVIEEAVESNSAESDDFTVEEPVISVSEENAEVTDMPEVSESAEETEVIEPCGQGPATDTEASDETATMIPADIKEDVKSVLMYMDQLLENLPEEKIAEFARSEHFDVYKKLFTELGLA